MAKFHCGIAKRGIRTCTTKKGKKIKLRVHSTVAGRKGRAAGLKKIRKFRFTKSDFRICSRGSKGSKKAVGRCMASLVEQRVAAKEHSR